MADLQASVALILQDIYVTLLDYVPRIFFALVIVLIGVLIALATQIIARFILKRVGLDALSDRLERAGFEAADLMTATKRVVPRLLFFVVLLVFLQIGMRTAAIPSLERIFSQILGFVPNLLSAALILLAGRLIGRWLGRIATDAARASRMHFARPLGGLVSTAVLVVAIIITLAQLQIHALVLDTLLVVAFASVCLTLTISLGLGSREITRNILAGFYVRKHLEIGRTVEVLGHKGVLSAVDATQTTLRNKGKSILLANSVVFSEAVQQSED